MKKEIKIYILILLCVILIGIVYARVEIAESGEFAAPPVETVVAARNPIAKNIHKTEKTEVAEVIEEVVEAPEEPVEAVEEIVVVDIEEEPVVVPEEPVELPKLYTDADAIALAQTCYGESMGVPDLVTEHGVITNKCQNAAVMWSILNRYDDGSAKYFGGDTIASVAAAPGQYHGYSPKHPIDEKLLKLAYDVLDRWNREKHGETDVGRVLPADYMWFHGDGKYNHFRNTFKLKNGYWDWSLPDVYAMVVIEVD